MDKQTYQYISDQANDPIVERKTCEISWQEFPIYKSDLDFYNKISPTFKVPLIKGGWGVLIDKKFQIPNPTLSPQERAKRRMSYKNDRTLYKNTCACTGDSIISIYSPESKFKVYNIKDWRSDKRNPVDYGFDFDFTKSFFSQFNQLNNIVPKIAMVNDNWTWSENCEYCQNVAYSKNCYLTTVWWKLENSHYNSNMAWWKRLLDCFFTMDSEICYECTDSYNLYWCFWLKNSNDSSNCLFGYDLVWCSDCICCVWLRNKQYYILNKQYSKQDFFSKKIQIQKQIIADLNWFKSKFKIFLETQPKKAINVINSENSFWNNLVNASNSILCYNIKNLKNCRYSIFWDTLENAYDLTVWWELERCYEWIVPDHSNRAFFTIFCRSCSDVRYSEMCHNCQNCFWCVWLKNKQYCVFNKQYTKEEYNKLVPKIIEHMQSNKERWEFFPTKYSPFKYNETIAQEYFPLMPENVEKYQAKWLIKKPEVNISDWIKFIDPKTLFSDPNLIEDSILNQAIICEESGRPFRIITQELEFYRKYKIPLPHRHPDIRSLDRIKSMPSKTISLQTCNQCKKTIITPYKNNHNIYCELCYDKKVIW